MTLYAYGNGHNVADGSLTDADPQPRTPGILYPELIVSLSGKAFNDGSPFTEWEYRFLTYEVADDIFDGLGISESNPSNTVTIRQPDNSETWYRYNATALYPQRNETISRLRGEKYGDIKIRFINLERL